MPAARSLGAINFPRPSRRRQNTRARRSGSGDTSSSERRWQARAARLLRSSKWSGVRSQVMRKKNIAATLVTVGSCIALLIIALQSAPAAEPLHILIGVPPGGSLDRLARTLGEGYRQQTGQPVVVESKVGANSIIAARACKAAEPDGLTICLLGNDTV